jgi:hypothetical protein
MSLFNDALKSVKHEASNLWPRVFHSLHLPNTQRQLSRQMFFSAPGWQSQHFTEVVVVKGIDVRSFSSGLDKCWTTDKDAFWSRPFTSTTTAVSDQKETFRLKFTPDNQNTAWT